MNGKEFFSRLPERFIYAERVKIEQAYWLAKAAHRLQNRDGGERYFNHPRRVALYALKYWNKKNAGWEFSSNDVIVALLHDVVEDCYLPADTIRDLFGEEVHNKVFRLSKKIPEYDDTSGYIIRKIKLDTKQYLQEMAKEGLDAVCIIKMADRLDNIRTMKNVWQKERQIIYIQETKVLLDIFSVFAKSQIYKDLQKETDKILVRLKKQKPVVQYF